MRAAASNNFGKYRQRGFWLRCFLEPTNIPARLTKKNATQK